MRARTHTPWTPKPDGTPIERSGAREWFGDHVFVDARPRHARAGYGTSFVAHTSGTVALVLLVWIRPPHPPSIEPHPPATMAVTLSLLPMANPSGSAAPLARAATPETPPAPSRPGPAPPPPDGDHAATAPLDAPSSVALEPDSVAGVGGVVGGLVESVPTGVPRGVADGAIAGDAHGGGSSAGPIRAGGGIKPPRKITDAKPSYPMAALSSRARGTVILDITIDAAGKVADAKILQSIPVFDQAALDAVRQWEYEPSTLNGVPVAVLVTVVLTFQIQ